MKLIKQALPDFYQELKGALEELNRTELTEQLQSLAIVKHTIDKTGNAIYLYTSDGTELKKVKESVAECLDLKSIPGMVVMDLGDFNRIMGIEVLDRPDVGKGLKN